MSPIRHYTAASETRRQITHRCTCAPALVSGKLGVLITRALARRRGRTPATTHLECHYFTRYRPHSSNYSASSSALTCCYSWRKRIVLGLGIPFPGRSQVYSQQRRRVLNKK